MAAELLLSGVVVKLYSDLYLSINYIHLHVHYLSATVQNWVSHVEMYFQMIVEIIQHSIMFRKDKCVMLRLKMISQNQA